MARKMKDSGIEWIGEIPEDWDVVRLKQIITCKDGERIPIDSALRESGPYPYWGAGNIVDYVKDYLFDEELVLLGEDGAPFFDKKRNVAFLVNEKIWVNNHIHVLKADKDVISSYLVFFLNVVDFGSYINGSILNKLTQSNMNKINIAFPSRLEQQRIADFLDTKCAQIDEILQKTRDTIAEYKKLKQSIITQAVTKGVRGKRPMKDSGIEWIGEIPEEWEAKPIKAVASYNDELLNENTDKEFEFDYIDIGSVQYGKGVLQLQRMKFSQAPSRARRIVKSGDVIISTVRTYLKAVSTIEIQDMPQVVSTGFVVIRAKSILSSFLNYAVLSEAFICLIESMSTGISYPAINSGDVVRIKIPIPDKLEQQEIAAYLDQKCAEIDKLIEKKEQLIGELESYKKSLIYEYVTGKKEVVI